MTRNDSSQDGDYYDDDGGGDDDDAGADDDDDRAGDDDDDLLVPRPRWIRAPAGPTGRPPRHPSRRLLHNAQSHN